MSIRFTYMTTGLSLPVTDLTYKLEQERKNTMTSAEDYDTFQDYSIKYLSIDTALPALAQCHPCDITYLTYKLRV